MFEKMSAIIFQHGLDDYELWTLDLTPEEEAEITKVLAKFMDSGCSVRGTKAEIADEVCELE